MGEDGKLTDLLGLEWSWAPRAQDIELYQFIQKPANYMKRIKLRSRAFSEAGMLKEESCRIHQGVTNAHLSHGTSSSGGEWGHRQAHGLSVTLRVNVSQLL